MEEILGESDRAGVLHEGAITGGVVEGGHRKRDSGAFTGRDGRSGPVLLLHWNRRHACFRSSLPSVSPICSFFHESVEDGNENQRD